MKTSNKILAISLKSSLSDWKSLIGSVTAAISGVQIVVWVCNAETREVLAAFLKSYDVVIGDPIHYALNFLASFLGFSLTDLQSNLVIIYLLFAAIHFKASASGRLTREWSLYLGNMYLPYLGFMPLEKPPLTRIDVLKHTRFPRLIHRLCRSKGNAKKIASLPQILGLYYAAIGQLIYRFILEVVLSLRWNAKMLFFVGKGIFRNLILFPLNVGSHYREPLAVVSNFEGLGIGGIEIYDYKEFEACGGKIISNYRISLLVNFLTFLVTLFILVVFGIELP